jgi:hypothetical protein
MSTRDLLPIFGPMLGEANQMGLECRELEKKEDMRRCHMGFDSHIVIVHHPDK